MIPTFEQYEEAKKVVDAYEKEQKRLYNLRVKAFELDLKEYFKTHLIDGRFYLKEFELQDNSIIPINPCMEESYEGWNNEDIEILCKKHNVKFSIIYWCYHK